MKPSEIREKSEADLKKMQQDLQEELFRVRIKKVTGQLEKLSSLKAIRHDLARVQTILRERTQTQAKGSV